jgi:hypothetical protein
MQSIPVRRASARNFQRHKSIDLIAAVQRGQPRASPRASAAQLCGKQAGTILTAQAMVHGPMFSAEIPPRQQVLDEATMGGTADAVEAAGRAQGRKDDAPGSP